MNVDMIGLVRAGGILHLVVAGASLAVPRVLDWRHRLEVLDRFHRRLFWVYAGFTLGVNTAFGAISLLEPEALVAEPGLGRLVAATIAIYWLARLAVQLLVFDSGPPVEGRLARSAHHLLTVAFAGLTALYGCAVVVSGGGA